LLNELTPKESVRSFIHKIPFSVDKIFGRVITLETLRDLHELTVKVHPEL
jgi:hypothetical protein